MTEVMTENRVISLHPPIWKSIEVLEIINSKQKSAIVSYFIRATLFNIILQKWNNAFTRLKPGGRVTFSSHALLFRIHVLQSRKQG